jgi:hypothetical protein
MSTAQANNFANTPWGNIAIFNGDNYKEFAESCIWVLIGA